MIWAVKCVAPYQVDMCIIIPLLCSFLVETIHSILVVFTKGYDPKVFKTKKTGDFQGFQFLWVSCEATWERDPISSVICRTWL